MLFIAATLFSLIILPAGLLVWLVRRSASVGLWALKTGAVGSALLALFYIGSWQVLSYYARYGLLALFIGMALVGAWRMRGRPVWARPRGWQWGAVVVAALVLVLAARVLIGVWRAQDVRPSPVALAFPLKAGTFYVASGESHPILNPHMKVAASRFQPWRGQMWALDIVELQALGQRARGLYPKDLAQYAIFGEPVFAPCDGQVEAIENNLLDLVPPATDTTNKAGNYVMLRCGPEAYVLLAHLQQGSVAVQPGQRVSTGARLGAVGNSGNTTEPHLHVHAQRAAGGRTLLDADPRPITFDGASLVRNDVVWRRRD